MFGIDLVGQGTVDLVGIGFPSFTNTHTISGGTLILFYWNELNSPSTYHAGAAIVATDTTITLSAAGRRSAGDRIQIEAEILQVSRSLSGGTQYQVTRGRGWDARRRRTACGVADLRTWRRMSAIVPFVTDFFGSPASGRL